MATGADIPPELFRRILFDVCEDAEWLLDLSQTVPNRKEAIKNVTACSLTCVYWAHICREKLFWRVWIKSYEDMCAFVSLEPNTPTRFAPISEYVWQATLAQRVGDRPWLHLVQMQPSLFVVFQSWRRGAHPVRASIYFHIEDSPNNVTNPQRSISRRLFASLPRALPWSCLQCDSLRIDQPCFVTPHDLTFLLHKFRHHNSLELTGVTWDAQTCQCLERDLLIRDPLDISFRHFCVEVHSSEYTAETAWLAVTAVLRRFSRQNLSMSPPAALMYKPKPTLRVLPSTQRAILDICKSFCLGPTVSCLKLRADPDASPWSIDIPHKDTRAYMYNICDVEIRKDGPIIDGILHGLDLSFYDTRAMIPDANGSDSIVTDSISVLCAHIEPTEEFSTAGRSFNVSVLPDHALDPWAEVARLCAAQTEFIRLQLQFGSHGRLFQFMEAHRAALGKLNDRITLFYYTKDWKLRAADFETLADLGDAREHGYIIRPKPIPVIPILDY